MTALAPTRPLTPSEQRAAQHLVDGLNVREIAAVTQLKPATVYSTLRTVRWKLRCPERCSLAVVAHHLLHAGEVDAPAVKRPAPDAVKQISLLKAVTEHSLSREIAHAAGLAPADLRAALDQLLTDTGARDTTELVVLAHSWQLLPSKQDAHATGHGVSQ
ncbi:LuxR C-terminal-related transcriptional regulator [Streptomyces sp. NPDC006285]|uniref:LuxR C-terminal-related transcriptional regulator n=1 Tax=Streptomyces sp. NPDC006285 TaxID=3364742 RepID=UPI0036B285E0